MKILKMTVIYLYWQIMKSDASWSRLETVGTSVELCVTPPRNKHGWRYYRQALPNGEHKNSVWSSRQFCWDSVSDPFVRWLSVFLPSHQKLAIQETIILLWICSWSARNMELHYVVSIYRLNALLSTFMLEFLYLLNFFRIRTIHL